MIDLRLGDCVELMRGISDQSVDAIVTDPPYLEGDFSYLLSEFERVAKRVVLTPGKIESFNWIARKKPVWEYAWRGSTKSLGGSACLHIGFEPILAYQYPKRPLGNDVLDFPVVVDPSANGHPWPKPLLLMQKLVAHWSNEGETILDPFMGAGTVGVACVKMSRHFIGFEINPDYFAIAKRRIEDAQLQPVLMFAEAVTQ